MAHGPEEAPVKKIPTVFVRDWNGNPQYVTGEPNPECAWVFAGEGTPTRKYDGTCVRFDGDRWWARREVKPGKADPAGFELVEQDAQTGKRMGWEPVEQSAFARFHAEALVNVAEPDWRPGTYELIGPKVNGNPERAEEHVLVAHEDAEQVLLQLKDFDSIAEQLHMMRAEYGMEGIVWHHPDGRMAKLKARDFPKPA